MTATVAAALALAWAVRARAAESAVPTEPAIPRGALIASWFQNGADGVTVLQLVSGRGPAPGATVAGTVTSDTTCTPDGEGLSHCHNDIDLDNGARITVVHHHAMLQHPCLTPGERVTLRGVTASWIVARASGVRHAPITTP